MKKNKLTVNDLISEMGFCEIVIYEASHEDFELVSFDFRDLYVGSSETVPEFLLNRKIHVFYPDMYEPNKIKIQVL